jgi:hypothetical protein
MTPSSTIPAYRVRRVAPGRSRDRTKQGVEGAPDAWQVFSPEVAEGIHDLAVDAEVFVLTWPHQARRDVLAVFHPSLWTQQTALTTIPVLHAGARPCRQHGRSRSQPGAYGALAIADR